MSKIDIVTQTIEQAISTGALKSGDRLASIRVAAGQYGVSKNTIIEAYARLAAQQVIFAKHGSGYFVPNHPQPQEIEDEAVAEASGTMSLLRAQLTQKFEIRPGDGRPPLSWMTSALPKRIDTSTLVDAENDHSGYGNPLGHSQLRDLIAKRFAMHNVSVAPKQVVTTFGANHALDLIIRRFLSPGQIVLVDEPGYYPLLAKLKLAQVNVVGVPRRSNGPDIDALERLAVAHQPKMYFTQSTAHNPTGSSYDLQTAHSTLRLAAQFGFTIIDDDPFIDLQNNGVSGTRLWELDGFKSVIFVGTYSKLLSASFRSGYIIAPAKITEALTDLKIVTSVNSSRMSEMLISSMIKSGRYDRHLKKLGQRLIQARTACLETFSRVGVTTAVPTPSGYYSLISLPKSVTNNAAQEGAIRSGIFIAPGQYFYLSKQCNETVSMRINFSRSANKRFSDFLQTLCTQ